LSGVSIPRYTASSSACSERPSIIGDRPNRVYDLIRPILVQGSASSMSTVLSNQTLFSIEASSTVGRPTRNGTDICFHDADTNVSVVCYDAGYASDLVYTGNTIVIVANYSWTSG
ncbi:unnamed protein product, partial [Adineta ricciae]